MIHVTWPPGCYGTYVMQSIYAYSNLGNGNIVIDPTGSSHSFRERSDTRQFFDHSHIWSEDTDVHINPVPGHELDYLNNQLVKQEDNDIVRSFKISFPTEFDIKIGDNWTSNSPWTLREWCSFWIEDFIQASYQVQPTVTLTANDLFDVDNNVFSEIINRLGLTVTTDTAIMKLNQARWIEQQRFHNSQQRCNLWVQDVLTDNNTASPCQTLLDEAYVQHCLREQGYEIQCDGLDTFPIHSRDLREIIYENSNTNNQR